METGGGKQHLDLISARKNLADIIDLSDSGRTSEYPKVRPQKEALLNEAKRLRQRAEALIEEVDDTDADELQSLINDSKKALADGDMEKLAQLNESMADMLFYLED